MALTSIVIPSRNEQFLNKTILDLLSHAEGEIEIIVNLDGYWPEPIISDPRVVYIHQGKAKGMRAGINAAVAIAKGKYILKTDAHCMWGPGYDRILAEDCESNWVVVPRRKRLDAENWAIQETRKPDIDYMYLSYPNDPMDFGGKGLNGKVWDERNRDESLKAKEIDDLMSAQGSAWFMHRDYFYELELMDEQNWGTFWGEFQEIGFKCWLSGGRIVVNKNTNYAHLHKGKKYGRMYSLDHSQLPIAAAYGRRWMDEVLWDKQTMPFYTMIERFWPLPGWPEDWLDKAKEQENANGNI